MDKKILISIGLSLATVWGLQYYMGSKARLNDIATGGAVSVATAGQALGGSVKVAVSEDLFKPLNTHIDFAQEKMAQDEQLTHIDTLYTQAVVSSHGATLKTLDFKKHLGKNNKPLRTVYNHGSFNANGQLKGCFLLALEKETPYFYELVERSSKNNKEYLVYRTKTVDWTFYKTYVFYQDSYQIDLVIRCEPNSDTVMPIKPRLFFIAPYMNDLQDDIITPFMFNERQDAIEKKELGAEAGMVWYWQGNQVVFGAYDRYFAHALVKDSTHFAQRAYFKKNDSKTVLPILEGPSIVEAKEWEVSFYLGPKVYDHLAAGHDALPDILNFGWLSALCTLLLKALAFVQSYVGNFGLAIIVLTILLRLPVLPLSIYSRIKMEKYQKHAPIIARIRAKFKNDAAMQQQEIIRYHQEHDLSPATPLIGCLPLLLQMPILFSLYNVLGNYLDLYQAPFYGWIVDLSAKDPFYVLPILMGLSMIWTQMMSPVSDDKQRVTMIFVSLIMTVVFSSFPAGLVLYWFMNNMLTVGEDYLRKVFFS